MFICKILKAEKEKDIKSGTSEQARTLWFSWYYLLTERPRVLNFKQLRDRSLCVNTQSGIEEMELRCLHVVRALEEIPSRKSSTL